MKTTLIFVVIFGIVIARPQNFQQHAYITRYDSNVGNPEGYYFNVETSDGFRHYQTGELKNAGSKREVLVVTGSYSYIGPDGRTYTVVYVADENGFHPAGEHLPPSAGVKKLGKPPQVPGPPPGKPINSATLGSLIGGNSLG